MENKTRILLVDDDQSELSRVAAYFENYGFEVSTATNGAEAVIKFEHYRPDVMVLDMLMPVRDGMSVLGAIEKQDATVVAVSALSGEAYAAGAVAAGADYFILKPYALDDLKNRIEFLRRRNNVQKPEIKGLEKRISDIFMTVGIPAHIKGYQFLREAIRLAIESPDIINSVTKRLYPTVAAHYSTSPSKVERAIRHAIEVAWNRGKIENINSLFGVKIYSDTEKPTNSEFIALVADKLLIENL